MSIYPVSAAANPKANDSSTTGNTGTTSSTTTANDYASTFMQLLATELQSQDPTQTVDPTTMVTQMVEINQLSDVAGIYSILQGQGTGSTTAAASHPGVPTSAHASNSTHPAHSSVGGN